MNVLYLDDYINYYSEKLNKIISLKPYKDTLRNGYIINRIKFIKIFDKLLKDIKPGLLNESITVIINNYATYEDKLLLKDVLNELNYKKVLFVNEERLLKVNKNKIYINCNSSYFYILHINYNGNLNLEMYKNIELNRNIIIELIKKQSVILYGKNIKDFINVLDNNNINYYVYENYSNVLIELYLSEKNV